MLATLPYVEVFLPLDSLIHLSVKTHTPDNAVSLGIAIAQD